MSAEHRGRKDSKKSGKPSKGGSSLTDAVVAALAKVDDAKDKVEPVADVPAPPLVESRPGALEPATLASASPPPVAAAPMVEPEPAPVAAPNGAHGFRSGPGSFSDLIGRWSGAPPMAIPAVSTALAPASSPPEADAPAPADPVAPATPPAAAAPDPVVSVAALAALVDSVVDARASTPAPAPQRTSAPPPSTASDPAGGGVHVRYYGRTDVGLVREHNEDNFVVVDLDAQLRGTDTPRETALGPRGCIFAVCDGMGGAAAGEVASQMAADTIHEVFAQGEPTTNRDDFARRLVYAVEEAGHRIFSAAKMDRTRRGMGTTATLAGLVDNVLFVGQVGDSRAYVLRGDQLELITKDQSLVNQLIEAGQLTEEEAEAFEHSNIILQALGTTEDVTVDLTFLELRRGDRLLICSDGLSGLVHSEMIRETLQTLPDLSEAAARLIQMANGGGGHDNITVILADFDGEGLAAADGARVRYQQYPLPADTAAPGYSLAAREPTMKTGAPKPGADVKRDEPAAAYEPAAAAQGGGSKRGLILVGLAGLVLLAIVGILALGALGGGDEDASAPSPADAPRPLTGPPNAPNTGSAPGSTRVGDASRGRVVVRTDIAGATLWINGESRGSLQSGLTLQLAPGAYEFEARVGDAAAGRATVEVRADRDVTVQLDAERGADPDDPPPDVRPAPVAPPEPVDTARTAPVETPRPAPRAIEPRPTKRERPRIEPRAFSPGGPSITPGSRPSELPSNPFK